MNWATCNGFVMLRDAFQFHVRHLWSFFTFRTPCVLQKYFKNTRTAQIISIVNSWIFINLKSPDTIFELFGKDGRSNKLAIRPINSCKTWMRHQYLPENMNGILVILGQYLPENMEWTFSNMGLVSFNKRSFWPMLVIWERAGNNEIGGISIKSSIFLKHFGWSWNLSKS